MLLVTFLSFSLLTIIVFILIFMLLLNKYPVRVAAAVSYEQQFHIHITATWLNPFIKGLITTNQDQIVLEIYLFEKRIIVKGLADKTEAGYRIRMKNHMDYIKLTKSFRVDNTKLYTAYGFSDPAITGIFYGAVGLISQYIKLNEFYNNADFMPDHSFFSLNVNTEINAAKTIIEILLSKVPVLNTHSLGTNR